jgi:hypothetical protein
MSEHDIDPPGLELFTRLLVQVDPPVEAGETGQGVRRIVPITGGRVEGPGLRGTIGPGGADVQLIRLDGVAVIAARYIITTDRGTHVFIENEGVRHGPAAAMERIRLGELVDPGEIYFRSVPRFETDDPELRWIERDLFIATGARFPDRVQIDVYHVT